MCFDRSEDQCAAPSSPRPDEIVSRFHRSVRLHFQSYVSTEEELIYGDSGSRKYVGNDVPTGQVATGGSPADIDLSLLSVHDL